MNTIAKDTVPNCIIYPSDGLRFQCAGLTITVKTLGDEAERVGSVFELQLPPYSGRITPHRHRVTTEWFYVLHGACAFTLHNETAVARVGACIFVAPDVPHTFWNPTAGATTLLGVRSYPGMQQYLADFTALSGKTEPEGWSVDALAASASQLACLLNAHDLFPVDGTAETILRNGQCIV